MREHGLLDWRLGVSLLRVMHDPAHDICCNSPAGTLATNMASYEELEDWLSQASQLQTTLCASRANISSRTYGDLPGVYDSANDVAYLIIHPLWNDRIGPGTVIRDSIVDIASQDPTASIEYINTFNGVRSPSSCLI